MHFNTLFQKGIDILLAPYSLDYSALKKCILSNDSMGFRSAMQNGIKLLENFCTNRVQLIKEDLHGSHSFVLVGALKQEIRNIVNLIDLNIQAIHRLEQKFEKRFHQPYSYDISILDEHLTYLRSVLLKESLDKVYAAFNLSYIVPFDVSVYIANDDSASFQSSEFYSAVVKNPKFLTSVAKILLVNSSFKCFGCLRPFLGEKIDIAEIILYMTHRKSLLEPLAGFLHKVSSESFEVLGMHNTETIQACVDSNCYVLVSSVVECLMTQSRVVVTHACLISAIRNQNIQILKCILPLAHVCQKDWHYFFQTCCQIDSHDCLAELIRVAHSSQDRLQLAHFLVVCAKCDSTGCLKVLLNYGVDINYREASTGRTALIEAIRHGSPGCANLLLMHEASQEAADIDNWSAVDHDIYRGTRVLYEPTSMKSNVRLRPYIADTSRLKQTINEDILRVYFAIDFEKPVENEWRFLFDETTRVQVSILMGRHPGSVIFTSSLLQSDMVDGSFDINFCEDFISTHADSVLLIHMYTDTGQMLSTGTLSLEPITANDGILHVKAPMLTLNGKYILNNFFAVLIHVKKYTHDQMLSQRCVGFLNQKPWVSI